MNARCASCQQVLPVGTTDKPMDSAGWGFPGPSRKGHYFPAGDSFSVCGKYGFYIAGPRDPETGTRSPDDCAACVKKLPNA